MPTLPDALRRANGDLAPVNKTLTITAAGRCEIDWTLSVDGTALDITGCTVACRIATSLISGTTIATFTGSVPVGTDGRLLLVLDESVTATLGSSGSTWTETIGVYQVTISDGTDTVVLAYGEAKLIRKPPAP